MMEHTLREIATEFGISAPRVEQIAAKAMRKLRHPSRSILLSEFVEGSAPREMTWGRGRDGNGNRWLGITPYRWGNL